MSTDVARNFRHFCSIVEAITLYDSILLASPRFAIARGIRGLARLDFVRVW
jgi:hypothetical protein